MRKIKMNDEHWDRILYLVGSELDRQESRFNKLGSFYDPERKVCSIGFEMQVLEEDIDLLESVKNMLINKK